MSVDFGIPNALDGVRRRLFGRELDERVALLFERAYLLDGAELRERGLHQLVRDGVGGEPAAVHGAVRRRALVVDLVERRLLGPFGSGGFRFSGRGLASGPIGADGPRSQPLSVHRRDGEFGFGLFNERYESVAFGLEGLGIADDATVGDLSEGSEGLPQGLGFDFGRKIPDEDVMMVGGVGFRLVSGRRGPVDLDLLVEEDAFVHSG